MNTYIKILFIGVFLYFIYTYLNNKKENIENVQETQNNEEQEGQNNEEQENNIPEFELTKEQKIDKLTKEYFDAENEILKKIKASRDRRERKLLNEQIEELYAKLKKNIDEI
jgi:DNA anti-recombination protein RmuC